MKPEDQLRALIANLQDEADTIKNDYGAYNTSQYLGMAAKALEHVLEPASFDALHAAAATFQDRHCNLLLPQTGAITAALETARLKLIEEMFGE